MNMLDLEALERTPLTRDPFDFMVVRDFIRPQAADALRRDFPDIPYPGLLPVEATHPGPSFAALIQALQGVELTSAVSRKFGIDLLGTPMMITVRGRCDARDGRIHTDSETKVVTCLLYFNDRWDAAGGRLRLLRGPNDLNDVIAEVPPDFGTLIAFRRAHNSWHGHEPFVGPRRYVMFNWMANSFAARREIMRHRLSAVVKRNFSHPAPAPSAQKIPEQTDA